MKVFNNPEDYTQDNPQETNGAYIDRPKVEFDTADGIYADPISLDDVSPLSKTNVPLVDIDDPGYLREAVTRLWNLLDDIDTISDMAKGNNQAYRDAVEKRVGEGSGHYDHFVSDGYNLYSVHHKADCHIENAMTTLRTALKDDPDYAWSWHCNLAMSAQDNGVDHETSQKIASWFMKLCFDVETKEPPKGEQGDNQI